MTSTTDFNQMTADELKIYQGKKYWACTEHLAPSGRSYVCSDFESTTYENLIDKLNLIPSLRVFESGVTWRWADGRTENIPDHLRLKSDSEIEAALSHHEPCEGYNVPDSGQDQAVANV